MQSRRSGSPTEETLPSLSRSDTGNLQRAFAIGDARASHFGNSLLSKHPFSREFKPESNKFFSNVDAAFSVGENLTHNMVGKGAERFSQPLVY